MQRRVDALLDQADAASDGSDWATVAEKARAVLAIDEANEDALSFLKMAEANGVSRGQAVSVEPESSAPAVLPAPARALPESFAAGRYAVRRFLGEGGSKKVYLAHDTRLDRDVAVAVVAGLGGESLERVRREAQAVARLGEHPNIVAVFDTGEDGDTLYTVYQYMAGGTLADRIAAALNHSLPFDEAVRYASQVCAALAFAHARGVIHRDLKPANVFRDESGTAKLGDFGLAAALDRTRMTQQGSFLGTATYMAPEQAMGQPPDPRSDLYSLGCVLYELLTGRPPFVGDDTVAVVTQHLNTPPVAPSWHRAEVPPGLETLVLRLLEKDPSKRPSSATETGDALVAAASGVPTAPLPEPGPRDSELASDPLYRTVFVGREAELRQLQGAFDGALSGNGALVMVVGEPGIGKTSVCEQLATYAAMRGGRTLRGHCYEEGSLSLPYLPFVEAMRTYVLNRDAEALRSELGSNAPYVARIVSEVREKLDVEQPEGGDPEDDRWRLLQGVTTFLRNAANVQPLVIVLEDLHWADKGTLDVLTHLARSLEGARLLIVGTYRDVEVDRSHALSGALADLRRITNFSRVSLRGLGADDVQKMLATIAGREVPWALAEQVHRQTEGNPLFVQEVLRYLVEEGFLQRDSRGELHRPSSDISLAMQIPEGLRDVIGKRLSRLSPETNRVLAVAAVIGRDFRLDVLQDVAAVTEEELYAALEEASGKGVIEERRQQGALGYRFTHAFLRQTLYEEIFTPRRIRTHQQVARAMEARYASRVAEHAAELAEHFAQSTDADDLAKAVRYGELAAERAMGVYAYAEAARLLEGALQAQEVLDPGDRSRRCDVLLALCTALNFSDQPGRVRDELAVEALRLAEGLGERTKATRAVLLALEACGRVGGHTAYLQPPGLTWLEQGERIVEPGTLEWVAVGARLAVNLSAGGFHRASFEQAMRAWEVARRLGDPRAIVEVAGLGILNHDPLPGQIDFVSEVAREVAQYPPHGITPISGSVMFLYLRSALLAAGDRHGADRAVARMEEAVRVARDPLYQRLLNWTLLRQAVLDGDLERAAEVQAEGTLMIPEMRHYGPALLLLGRPAEAIASSRASLRAIGPLARGGVAVTLAHAGAADEARAVLLDALSAESQEKGLGTGLATGFLEAALLLGEHEVARQLADHLAPAAHVPITAFGTTSVGRVCGDEAASRGAPVEARAFYDQALAACRKIRFRPEVAIVRLHIARLLLEHYPAERTEALDHLGFAIGEFQAMKMAPSLSEAMRLRFSLQGITGGDPNSSIVAVADRVQSEHPDISTHAAPDGTVTLMFSDIEGSTALNEQMGDAKWMELLRAHNAVIDAQVKAHRGHVVKTMGDGYMVAFKSAADGLKCAVAIQQVLSELSTQNSELADRVRVRIGLHTGEMVRAGDDFFGREVNFAARVASSASGGQVLVSAQCYGLLNTEHGNRFHEPMEVEFKGFTGTHRVYAVANR